MVNNEASLVIHAYNAFGQENKWGALFLGESYMIQLVCNGCKATQRAVKTYGNIPKPQTPWIKLQKKTEGTVNEYQDIHLCKDCANKVNLR